MTSEREPFTSGLEPFTRSEKTSKSKDAPAKPRGRPNLHCAMPKSLQFRLSHIIEAERRTPAVVTDKVIEDFISREDNEPRPYIPFELLEDDRCSRNYSIAPKQYETLRERAKCEGRSVQTLFIRAVYDYVRNSPDDPVRVEPKLEPSSELEPRVGGDLR